MTPMLPSLERGFACSMSNSSQRMRTPSPACVKVSTGSIVVLLNRVASVVKLEELGRGTGVVERLRHLGAGQFDSDALVRLVAVHDVAAVVALGDDARDVHVRVN